jgi:hypothetical protein
VNIMKTAVLLSTVAALLLLPRHAAAQEVRLEIHNGLVTLDAQNVSVRQILADWARVGGARIVNGEKVVGGPVTLRLNGTPERQALDTILRGVSGYMLAARQAAGGGPSMFDRILIMPTSSAPRAAGPVPGANAPFAPRPAQVAVQPVPAPEPVDAEEVVPDDDYDEQENAGEDDAEEAEPQPGNVPFQRPQRFPNPMGPQGQPFVNPVGPGGPPPFVPEESPAPGQPPSTAPLNVPPGASSMPGVIAPVPQQNEEEPQNRPPSPRRPPL